MSDDERLAQAVGFQMDLERDGLPAYYGTWQNPDGETVLERPDFANDAAACATWLLPFLEGYGEIQMEHDMNYGWSAWVTSGPWPAGAPMRSKTFRGTWSAAVTALALAVLDAMEEP